MSSPNKCLRRGAFGLAAAGLVLALATVIYDRVHWYKPHEAHYQTRPVSWWAMHCEAGRLNPQLAAGLNGEDLRFWFYDPDATIPADLNGNPWSSDTTAIRLMKGDPAALPVLMELLRDDRSSVRSAAVYGLACVAKKHRSALAIAALEEASHDDDEIIREYVGDALREFARVSGKTVDSNALPGQQQTATRKRLPSQSVRDK
jgi:hypothetical protein